MSRRVNLPGAEELFRPTQAPPLTQPGAPTQPSVEPVPQPAERQKPATDDGRESSAPQSGATPTEPDTPAAEEKAPTRPRTGGRKPSGRVKHDEKITVYVSRDELLAVETARLALRAEHDLAVDRGRLVRAALAAAVSDLEQHGGESDLVRRLSQ